MKETIIKKFNNGKWLDKSNSMLSDKAKLLSLLVTLKSYIKKGGLSKAKEDIILLGNYIGDIVHGKYRDYSKTSLTLAIASIIYVVSPLDIIPDLLPFGFIDDITIVSWAVSKLKEELDRYKSNK